MSDPRAPGRAPDVPQPELKSRRWAPRLVWLVPAAAALVGLSLLVKHVRGAGPRITITFESAAGIEAGKTLVKQHDVTIGRVTDVSLSDDKRTAVVTADLISSGREAAKQDSDFWIVRPRVGVGWVSGLDTLLSGSFIGVRMGSSTEKRTNFKGLEKPPPLEHGLEGRSVQLFAPSLASLALGAPVYFRHFQVGRIVDLGLMPNQMGRVTLFIDAPYDGFVNDKTRFWNTSGFDVKLGADGLKLKTESIAAIIVGGIAFDDGPLNVAPNAASALFENEEQALSAPSGDARIVKLRFEHAVRGLAVDAPVEFVGVNIGSVTAIDLGYDPATTSFPVLVTAKVFPHRMGLAYQKMAEQGATASDDSMADFMSKLVAKGFRAQARASSLISGSLYIAFDFVPSAEHVTFDPKARPLELPTLSTDSNEIERRLTHIAKTIDSLPLSDIAGKVDADLTALHGTLDQLQGRLLPQATATLQSMQSTLGSVQNTVGDESSLHVGIESTLTEARRTLESVRALTDYLDRHPEALLRGRGKHSSGMSRPKDAQP